MRVGSVLLDRFLAGRFLGACFLGSFLFACEKGGSMKSNLETDQEKASYAIGQQIGRMLKDQGADVNVPALAMSIDDVIQGREAKLSKEDMTKAMMAARAASDAKQEKDAEANQKSASEFLEKNKTAEGVQVTASGLQYKIITAGKGAKPKATDKVKVHYKGTLTNGEQFDSSYDRGEPASFGLNGVIPGWTEGLQLIAPGGKIQLFIPPELGYGRQAQGPIPANSTLIFEVELLEILKK